MKVLLVDDDADQLEVRSMVFEQTGFCTVAADSADAAYKAFEAEAPTHVVMDLRLPRPEDGLRLIRQFRSASSTLRILVLTGAASLLDGRPEGSLVDAVLEKPARTAELLEWLHAAPDCQPGSEKDQA